MSEVGRGEATVRRFLKALEAFDAEGMAACCTTDIVQRELPNPVTPKGAERGLADLREGLAKGRALLSGQSFEIVRLTGDDTRLVAETVWTGELRPRDGSTAPQVMRAHAASVYSFRDGLICEQWTYDCFEPFGRS